MQKKIGNYDVQCLVFRAKGFGPLFIDVCSRV